MKMIMLNLDGSRSDIPITDSMDAATYVPGIASLIASNPWISSITIMHPDGSGIRLEDVQS